MGSEPWRFVLLFWSFRQEKADVDIPATGGGMLSLHPKNSKVVSIQLFFSTVPRPRYDILLPW